MSLLYSAAQIGKLHLRNRIVMPAMHLAYCPDGEIGPRIVEFYRARARGGAGLIVIGAMGIDPVRVNEHGMVQIYDDRFIPGLRTLTDAVHAEGAKVFGQLFHPGRYARAIEYGGRQSVAPSAIASRFTGELPKELTTTEIEEIVGFFGEAAGRAQRAGFDGVEIVGNSGYLVAQFLSPLTNKRTDRYGGDLQGRLTFPLEIIAAIRQAVGEEFPVMFRLGGNDFIAGSNSHDEVKDICRALEQHGIDALDITGGWHESSVPQITMDVPGGGFSYLGKLIKSAVAIPVVMCNRMNSQIAEGIVDSGRADFIGIARGFIADPDLANKARAGAHDEIRPCIACNQGCLDNVLFGKTLSCLVNPEAGREAGGTINSSLAEQPLQGKGETILIIGGGPAGLEYAMIAALRGCRVVLWEEREALGGQAMAASIPPGREAIKEIIRYLTRMCRALQVEIVCGKKGTPAAVLEAVEKDSFNRIVIATGARPSPPTVAIKEGSSVVQAMDVLQKRAVTGERIVILGAGALGVETALFLADEGTMPAEVLRFLMLNQAEKADTLYQLLTRGDKQIVIIDLQQGVGKGMGPTTRATMMSQLKRYSVTIMKDTSALEINPQGVLVKHAGEQKVIEADTVVLAEKTLPADELFRAIKDKVKNIVVIGDAERPQGMQGAIRQAYDKAMAQSLPVGGA